MTQQRQTTFVRTAGIAVTAAAVVASGLTAAQAAHAAPKQAPSVSKASAVKPKLDAAKRKALADIKVPRRYGNGVGSAPRRGPQSYLLTLDRSSTSSVTRSNRGKGLAVVKRAAGAQRARIAERQRTVVADLPSDSAVLYRTYALAAGVAVRTDASNAEQLRQIDGVTGVYPITPKKSLNSYAVPHQAAAQAWQAYGDRGQRSTVAIIDSGVDYTHADFGGAGTKGAFVTAQSAAQQTSPTVFPTAKVIGGYDFVGDAYNADPTDPTTYSPTPKPDKNPLDCGGHGTHVAGSAAGTGVNADGTTYTGSYTSGTPFTNLKIGPGMAPEAKLYSFRVFGCAGSTDVTGAALERAIDPDGDGDTSDHVDVANLSLGSDFVPPGGDGDALLVKQASAAGVAVVAAAGNAGDVYDVAGTPANEPSAISVAASRDAQTVADGLNITAPAAAQYPALRSLNFDYATKDLVGNVVKLSAANATGCDALSNADKAAVTGKIAFLEWNNAYPACPKAAEGVPASKVRADNVKAAGGTGFIFGSNDESLSVGIGGNATIPGVLLAKSGADAIRSQLNAGQTVTVGSTEANAVKQQDDGQNEQVASFTSRGVRGVNGVKPDVAAIGETVFSAASGTGSDGLTESGTSMATPMTAGLAALIRSQHPEWSAEQVKADIVNTANADLYSGPGQTGAKFAPNRVGSGRIDAKAALDNSVLAYASGTGIEAGTVSASFGPVAATTDTTLTKTITVENTTLTKATFATGYSARTTMPGASYSVSPASVTVGPRAKATVTVTLTIDQSALTKTIDPTADREQPVGDVDEDGVVDTLPRQYVADVSGLVTLTPTAGSTVPLRVPVYAAPRPASTMTQAKSVLFPAGGITTAPLALTGAGVDNGSASTKVTSAVGGFELLGTSGVAPTCTTATSTKCVRNATERGADLKYVGSSSNAPILQDIGYDPLAPYDPDDDTSGLGEAYIAVSMQGAWRNPTGYQDLDVYIDSTGDGVADAVTYTTRVGSADAPTDVMLAVTESLTDEDAEPDVQFVNDNPGNVDTAVFDSDTLVLPVGIAALPGVTPANARIRYSVVSTVSGHLVDSIGDVTRTGSAENPTFKLTSPRTMNVLRPGVTFDAIDADNTNNPDNIGNSLAFWRDKAGTASIRRDGIAYAADGATGAMLVHLHNVTGAKGQVVTFTKRPSSATLRLTPTTVKAGGKIFVSISVAGTAGTTPAGTVLLQRYTAGKPAANVASATLSGGKASRTIVQGARGTFYYRVYFPGDSTNAAVYSAPVAVRAT